MRILTWNVNALKTTLDYHPWSQLANRSIEGLCEELKAEIICFQEHKARRDTFDKPMACPGPFDAFYTFPRGKTGYSGVCTYVDSRFCVPIKAEEGITGLTLSAPLSVMKPPWTDEERIGGYPLVDQVEMVNEIDGAEFDVKKLDFEGRAVVLDFGLFVLFNLYCPNETNDSRRPYKLNFLHTLEARVNNLQSQGREVIVVGDINVMRAPIDSGEGGIKVKSEDHYENPARRWFDSWIHPKGPMIDVVRECWPDREGMYTCWNTKLDARPSNYGSRIDYVLVTPGLRPWLKHGDIQSKIFGSDHCPVYVDLHDSIEIPGRGTVFLRDEMNPPNRPLPGFTIHPSPGTERTAPEPPRFATKHWDEFSGKQRSMKDFFVRKPSAPVQSASPSPAPTIAPVALAASGSMPLPIPPAVVLPGGFTPPLASARSAFDALDAIDNSSEAVPINAQNASIDLTGESPRKATPTRKQSASPSQQPLKRPKLSGSGSSSSKSACKPSAGGQTTLASFFKKPSPVQTSTLSSSSLNKPKAKATPPPSPKAAEEDALIAQSLADEEAERARVAETKNKSAASVWGQIMAKKIPPKCPVHAKPAKDFISGVTGKNKGKRFWVCSLPVGPGYDSGRKNRAREDVNPAYKCDFFMWDEDNHQKETGGKAVDWVPSKRKKSDLPGPSGL